MAPTFSVNTDVYAMMPKVAKLNLNPVRQIEQEWLSEAYLKIIEGNKDKAVLNLSAYSEACEKNAVLVRIKKGEVSLLNMDESTQGFQGIDEGVLVKKSWNDKFEEIEDAADVKFYIEAFLDMREYIYLEEGRDIWHLLALSYYDGNKKAQRKLKWVIEQYEGLGELIKQVILIPAVFLKLSSILG